MNNCLENANEMSNFKKFYMLLVLFYFVLVVANSTTNKPPVQIIPYKPCKETDNTKNWHEHTCGYGGMCWPRSAVGYMKPFNNTNDNKLYADGVCDCNVFWGRKGVGCNELGPTALYLGLCGTVHAICYGYLLYKSSRILYRLAIARQLKFDAGGTTLICLTIALFNGVFWMLCYPIHALSNSRDMADIVFLFALPATALFGIGCYFNVSVVWVEIAIHCNKSRGKPVNNLSKFKTAVQVVCVGMGGLCVLCLIIGRMDIISYVAQFVFIVQMCTYQLGARKINAIISPNSSRVQQY